MSYNPERGRTAREIPAIPFYLERSSCAEEESMGKTGHPVINIVSEKFYHAFDHSHGAVRIEVIDGLNLDIFWRKKGLGIFKSRQVFLALVEERDNKRSFLNTLTRQDIGGFLEIPKFTDSNLLSDYHYSLAKGDLNRDPGILQFPPENSPLNSFLGKISLLLDKTIIDRQQVTKDLEIALALPYFWAHQSQSPQFDHLAFIFPMGNLNLNNVYYELHVRMGYRIMARNYRINM